MYSVKLIYKSAYLIDSACSTGSLAQVVQGACWKRPTVGSARRSAGPVLEAQGEDSSDELYAASPERVKSDMDESDDYKMSDEEYLPKTNLSDSGLPDMDYTMQNEDLTK